MSAQENGFRQSSVPQEIVSWSAPARRFEEKNKLWFIGLGVVAIGSFIVLVLLNEFFLGLLFLSMAFLIFVLSSVRPPMVNYIVYTSGIDLGGKVYVWEDLDSFWIDRAENMLLLKTKLSFPSEVSIFIESGKDEEVEQILSGVLPYLERPRTDYMSVIDGFIGRFSEKLPSKFTRKIVEHPHEKMTVDPEKLTNKINQVKLGRRK